MQTPQITIARRPRLTADTAVEYLDWIGSNLNGFVPSHLEAHLRLAELAIRTRSNEAQAKATQHTLVESGVIAPPPAGPAAIG